MTSFFSHHFSLASRVNFPYTQGVYLGMRMRCLFLFRQDLRVQDNTGLREAALQCTELLPVFIFDEPILAQFPKPDARIGFLLETVFHLQQELRSLGTDLLILHGTSSELIPLLVKIYRIDAVFWNRSYGGGSRTRDLIVSSALRASGVATYSFPDFLLVEPQQIPARKVFTPFYALRQREKKLLPVMTEPSFPPAFLYDLPEIKKHILYEPNKDTYERLGACEQSFRSRAHCHACMERLPINEYDYTRNFPAKTLGTSRLSPYLRFGIVSPRQLLARVIEHTTPGTSWDETSVVMDKKLFSHSFVSELAWREFRRHIDWWFPEVRSVAFQVKRRTIARHNREDRFLARQEGRTGYPIVDAGMHQLQTMGWMHGRVRMIVASFLCKDLLIDRAWGERHFANLLIDYDPAVNMGNRQRSASVGADPKPLRIFNPILQSQKFDPDAVYIKQRLPELDHIPAKQLHDPLTFSLPWHTPIVNHYEMSKRARELYKGAI